MPHVHVPTAEPVEVLRGTADGVALIPSPSGLTRLNFYDGKFLRAGDLALEQEHLRAVAFLAARGGGAGVVDGFDVALRNGSLALAPGLAFDATGRPLLLPHEATVAIADLLQARRQEAYAVNGSEDFGDCTVEAVAPPTKVVSGATLYLVTIAHAEALCGEEDVYGRLCEEACVTATDRPYRVEGVVVRVRPLELDLGPGTGLDERHVRSRVASAYFRREALDTPALISGDPGLRAQTWCLGALGITGTEVPLAVLGLPGSGGAWLDAWTARRERIETPPRRYWAWRMAMRPWDVFLAQILQFQCQLVDVLAGTGGGGGSTDPCAEILERAQRLVEQVTGKAADLEAGLLTEASAVGKAIKAALDAGGGAATGAALLDGGIVELPSAGYLPVRTDGASVEEQVRALLGDELDLRFCVVRPDFVAHALEEAQHMERISLLPGRAGGERVDVLVPDGSRAATTVVEPLFDGHVAIGWGLEGDEKRPHVDLRGAARADALPGGGGSFAFAGATEAPKGSNVNAALASLAKMRGVPTAGAMHRVLEHLEGDAPEEEGASDRLIELGRAAMLHNTVAADRSFSPKAIRGRGQAVSAWVNGNIGADPFTLSPGDRCIVDVFADVATAGKATSFDVRGILTIASADAHEVRGTLLVRTAVSAPDSDEPPKQRPEQELEAVVSREDGDGDTTVRVRVGGEAGGIEIEATVGGDPTRLRAHGTTRLAGARVASLSRAADADFVHRPEVAAADDETHRVAVAALEVLQATRRDDHYAAARIAQLFGRADQPAEAIWPTKDWVLFHRRRDCDCSAAAAPAPPPRPEPPTPEPQAPPVAYAVWYARGASDIKRLLDSPTPARVTRSLDRVGSATFAADGTAVIGGAELPDRWVAATGEAGLSVAYVAVLGPDASAEQRERARGRAVLEVLDGVIGHEVAPDVEFQGAAPETLAPDDTVGAIIIAAAPVEQQATSCARLFVGNADAAEILRVSPDKAFPDGKPLGGALDEFAKATFADDAVLDVEGEIQVVHGHPLEYLFVVVSKADGLDPDTAMLRAKALIERLEISADPELVTVEALDIGCPMALVVPRPQ